MSHRQTCGSCMIAWKVRKKQQNGDYGLHVHLVRRRQRTQDSEPACWVSNLTYRWLFSRVPVDQAFVETSLCDSSSANTRHTTKRTRSDKTCIFGGGKITGKVTCLWLESQVSHTNISFLCVFFPAVQEKDSHWLILGNLPCIGWSSISIPFVYRRIPSILGNCPRLLLNMVDSRSDSAINTSGRTGDCFCLHRLSNPLEGNQTNTSLFNLTLQDEQC